MKFLSALFVVTMIAACSSNENKDGTKKNTKGSTESDSLLITENSWGAIQPSTDFDGLKKIYSGSVVADSSIMGPEGIDTLQVTYIHPGSPKELIIHWRDSLYHQSIAFIETYQENSPYVTAPGLKIGSTLRDLLQVNDQPIHFTGFGWDYGGYITSYNKGKLDSSKIIFRMEGKEELPQGLYGDSEFSTDMQLVKDNLDRIRIYSILLICSWER